MQEPLLSIITGTLDRPQSFSRMLASIEKHTKLPWELIVSDASRIPIECSSESVRIIREEPRLGFTKGYNQAFQQARGRYVMWLNDDAEVMKGYDEAAVSFMSHNPDVGLGAFFYRDEATGSLSYRLSSYWGMIYANFGIISKKLGDKIGWFDEHLVMYGSDNAFTFKVLLAGYGVAGMPGAFIRHHRVLDSHRVKNEELKVQDGKRLMEIYGRLRPKMQRRYRQFRHLTPNLAMRLPAA